MGRVLSDAAVSQYRETGAHSPVQILKLEQASALRAAIEDIEATRGPIFTESRPNPGDPFQGSYRFKSHLLFKCLADVIRHSRILDMVEDLIGPDILCWTTHWFIKEARSPKFVSWHQDNNYWGVETDDLVSVWLALSPATTESGCIRILPGSHKQPTFNHVDTWGKDNMLTRGQTINGIDEASAVELLLQTGQAAVFDYRLAHASHPNNSADRRIGLGIRYIPPTARQVIGDWDSASLVRGADRYGHFELEPEPTGDFDPDAVAMHQKADAIQRSVYYQGAIPEQAAE